MRLSSLGVVALCILCGLSAGCSGATTSTTPSGTPVVVTMHDSAPAGVTVFAYSMAVTGMTMQGSGTNVANLLAAPVTVHFQHLLTQNALLANTTAQPDTYSNLMITFATPSITILNGSTSAITVGGMTCAVGQICTLTPTLSQVSVSVTTNPFPLTLTNITAVNLDIDVNVSSILQNNLNVTPVVTVTTPPHVTGILQSINANGQVTAVTSSSFTMTEAATGNSLTFSTSSSTFTNFNTNTTNCVTPNTAPCLATTQNVNVTYNVPQTTPSSLQATSVILKNNIVNGIEGTVIPNPSNPTPNSFTMVVTGVSPSRTDTVIGEKLIVVNPASSSAFAVLPINGITIPSSLTFTGIANEFAGQTIDIDGPAVTPVGSSTVSPAGTETATTILLVPSQLIVNLSAVNGTNLTVNGLNGVFTGAGIPSMTVTTQSGTQFQGVSGLTGLTTNQPIVINGPVFTGTAGLTVVGAQVQQNLSQVVGINPLT